ncbi:hypothetical protein N7488_000885 [Penicillium malachiteum]|nr:hypothetical protein N7488_000885 [Penicillium malachiteum]
MMADNDTTHKKAPDGWLILAWIAVGLEGAACAGYIIFIVCGILKAAYERWKKHRRIKATSNAESTVYGQSVITTPGHARSDMDRDTRREQSSDIELQDLVAQTSRSPGIYSPLN